MDIERRKFGFAEEATRLCRVCLLNDQNSQCIFNDKSSCSLLQKLVFYGGIEIWENDGLPNRICIQCISKIDSAHEFRMQCQSTDQKLRQLFGKQLKVYKFSPLVDKKNESCQTNLEDFSINLIERKASEMEALKNKDNFDNNDDRICNFQDSSYVSGFHYSDVDENVTIENKTERDGASPRKELIKARRASVFKRVTSIENMKNHRERQRQYIKKSSSKPEDSTKKKKVTTSDFESEDESLSANYPRCDKLFTSIKSVEKDDCNQTEQLKCSHCDKQFSKREKLLSHEKLHECKLKSEPVRCQICDKSFRKTDTMVRHLNVHKKANPKEVFSILKEMRDKRKMEKDLTSDCQKGENMKKNCSDENKREIRVDCVDQMDFSSGNVNDSEELVDSSVSIYDCKYSVDSDSTDKNKEDKNFSCNICNMKFIRQDRLVSHKERYGHIEHKKQLDHSEKLPDDKSALKIINSWIREELDSDNEGKGFSCEICGKSYVTRKSLTKHKTTAHEGPSEEKDEKDCSCTEKPKVKPEKTKPYSCTECSKSFEKESKLEKHQRIHERAKEQQDSNFKRFLCHICSKTFRQNTGLMFHMRTHTGYKPHVCKYCGRGFTSNSNCINHERTHTGDRPFVCHFCSAAFAKSCTLKAHITTHTGEANYHCKTCGKSFRRLKYLKEHRFTHTGEKPYACKLCGTAYSHSGSLFVHEKKCKAHYNNSNFQTGVGQNNSGSYCDQTGIGISSTSPMINTIPIGNLSGGSINNLVEGNKAYIESLQRTTTQVGMGDNSGLIHAHSNAEIQDIPPVRNFAIIGQIFHT